jgi:transcriptional regulator with XRE-family HTH domain
LIIIDKNVCKRISYYRQERNLTRKELASKVGVRLNHLIRIETGSRIPRMNELAQLAAGLGVSISELVNGDE